jgi:hypothetical protein
MTVKQALNNVNEHRVGFNNNNNNNNNSNNNKDNNNNKTVLKNDSEASLEQCQ